MRKRSLFAALLAVVIGVTAGQFAWAQFGNCLATNMTTTAPSVATVGGWTTFPMSQCLQYSRTDGAQIKTRITIKWDCGAGVNVSQCYPCEFHKAEWFDGTNWQTVQYAEEQGTPPAACNSSNNQKDYDWNFQVCCFTDANKQYVVYMGYFPYSGTGSCLGGTGGNGTPSVWLASATLTVPNC